VDAKGRKDFGEYLKQLRIKAGLTQKQAADAADISVPYLAQTERGERNPPSRRVLARLAEVYGVAPQELLQKAERAEGLIKITDAETEVIEWAFQAVVADPKFAFGNRAFGTELEIETKAKIVKLYESATGKKLFNQTEAEAVDERLTGQTSFDFPKSE
jgi:transcriptional regulator with XRE-family HTH domain